MNVKMEQLVKFLDHHTTVNALTVIPVPSVRKLHAQTTTSAKMGEPVKFLDPHTNVNASLVILEITVR